MNISSHTLLQQPYFKHLLIGETSSLVSFQMIALILGWQMYDLTHHAFDLGLIGLFQFIPQCLLVLATGYVADHFNRKHITCLCQLLQSLVTLSLALGCFYHFITKELLLFCAILIGTLRAFEGPAL